MKNIALSSAIAATIVLGAASAHCTVVSARDILLDVVDQPALPRVTAKLMTADDKLLIHGEVHKRGATTLNGFVEIRAIAPDGTPLWDKKEMLATSGLRYFRYRYFDDAIPSIPPAGSKVVIRYCPPDSASIVDLSYPAGQRPLVL